MDKIKKLCFVALCLLLAGCGQSTEPKATEPKATEPTATEPAGAEPVQPAGVTAARIVNADGEPENWLTHGRTYSEQRYSPLAEIRRDNVASLRLAWYFDLPTDRGIEATPLVIDGRMYLSGSWSMVFALDAATGEELWRYDPKVSRAWLQYACCGPVNRGVAAWGDSIYIGTLDGYLVALDAATGAERWRTDTIDRQPPYTITGAPRVVDGLVIIGNGGADYGVRGYVSAYDAATGALRWRFHTVPGNPADGFENAAMEMAAGTWHGEWWQYGGGGTVWDSMAYDPELDLLYIGVGNGSPWNQRVRSPGGGDNLFLTSIVALRPATGEYVWHYQTVPGETWDYTATQHTILADLEIGGAPRQVLMQAPKNGFFYVLDRSNGQLISAEAYVDVNWASGIDPVSGRPVEAPGARYEEGVVLVTPSGFGGHNWHPMAFSPATGLVYLPAQDMPAPYAEEPGFEFTPGFWNGGTEFEGLQLPDDPAAAAEIVKLFRGQLLAWDPVAQREVWRYQHAGPWNGGVLATAGGLVFQGSLIGEFAAYDAAAGERLWQFPAQTGIAAAPISYGAGGRQLVAVAAGWGATFALFGGKATASLGLRNRSRVLAFSLDGTVALPAPEPVIASGIPRPPEYEADAAQLARGKDLYYERCAVCHGMDVASGGVLPDLRRAGPETHATWDAIVRGGLYRERGMPAFGQIFSAEDSEAVRTFVLERAWQAYDSQ
jgi:PQQ-dependent dehydrogenase (methanol/ethanol family)